MKTANILFYGFMLCMISHLAPANNISVANISLESLNTSDQTVIVQFDLSWENSWRISTGPSNWDAAWIFVKYRANNGNWSHARINVASPGVSGATIQVTTDEVGAMLYRDVEGTGDVNFTGVQLQWDYGDNGVTEADVLDIQVFAIEMVYVPEGSFFVGGTSGDEVNKFHEGGNTISSYQITSESAITIANTSGNLYYTADNGTSGDQTGTLSADFPKGFAAFYCMKYEVSEGQWVAFFNSLSESQKANRDLTDAAHKNSDAVVSRNTIAWSDGTSSATTTAPDRALNYANVGDINAYLDWSGLRPMTELEYEKACRGPVFPKAGEFAWGNANIASVEYTLLNDGASNEQISNPEEGTGNAIYLQTNGALSGPLRVGVFAASAINSNREETGGSYYGIMELSGNVYERCITVGTTLGRSFTGVHGNGLISSLGNANAANWPSALTGDGYSYRGAAWVNDSDFLRVSDRFDGASFISTGNNRLGFRGVRSF
ncbi:MAG: SUMF1/EgtB/PvdO family nonheme iron enzyme [Bacteroidota bacterium]